MRKLRGLAALLTLSVSALSTPMHDAEACGGFFAPRPNPERRPSLAYEQTLIVHDAQKGREHFIREVVFRASDETFGFVVPTPTLPEVAKVERSPFAKLREQFPFEAPSEGIGLGGLGTLGHGQGLGSGRGASVEVLDVQRVGSFTAFVLQANDASALEKWLADNGLVTSPEAQPWLAHYVAAKFYYVAMRYDSPAQTKAKGAAGADKKGAEESPKKPSTSARAEVVRISFDTPRPFYPYYEPNKPAGAPDDPRMLEIWLATDGPMSQPLGAREKEGKLGWARPFAEGQRYEAATARKDLAAAMGGDESLLPKGSLHLQRFMDQKRRRNGWGDVVFVPETRDPSDRATDAELRKLAAVLDPTLVTAESK